MSDWLNAVESQLQGDPDPRNFLRWLDSQLNHSSDPGNDCYAAASFLGSKLYLELAAIVFLKGAEFFLLQDEDSRAFACFANSGLYYHNCGAYNLALDSYDKAERLHSKWNPSWHLSAEQAEIAFGLNACDTLVELRKHQDALDRYHYIKSLCKQEEDVEGEIRCLLGEGNIYRNQSKFRLSLLAYKSACKLGRRQVLPRQVARSLHGMGNILMEINQTANAIKAFEEATEQYKHAKDMQGEIEATILLGHSHQALVERSAPPGLKICDEEQMGHLNQSQKYYQVAYQKAKDNDPINAADAQIKLASLAELLGHDEKSMQLYESLLENPITNADYFTARQVFRGLGDLLLKKEKFSLALDTYQKGLTRSKAAVDKDGEADFHTFLGYSYEKMEEFEQAISSYKNSITIQEQMGVDLGEEEHQIGFFELRIEVFEQLIGLFLKLRLNSQAFAYLEKSKAKAMRDQLARRQGETSTFNSLTLKEIYRYL